MPVPFLDLKLQYAALKEELDQVLIRIAASQQFILGPEVEALEEEMAEYLGVPHAVGVASGTDALLLPLKALDPEPGDEVILPAFTFFATAGAAWNAGFKPVFCDVDPHTFNVTADILEAVWTHRTRAVVPVHLYGQMAPMRAIRALASRKGAFVLEDAAQAVGARQRVPAAELGPMGEGGSDPQGGPDSERGSAWGDGAETQRGAGDGRGSRRTLPEEDTAEGWAMAGALGHAGAFSFFPTKNLGGFGDGGLVTTGDEVLADRIAKLRVHGGRQMYHHEMVGTNSRLDALQAAVLRVKLPHLDAWAEGRRKNARLYHQLLDGVDQVMGPVVE